MKRYFTLIPLFALASAALAQNQMSVGDVLDLEERVLVKKMNDELSKPNPNAPPMPPPAVLMPKAPKVAYPTQTLAVYGTSATSYEGQLALGGNVYIVQTGSHVQDYVVTSIAPHGIALAKPSSAAPRGKNTSHAAQTQTLFAPLVTR